MKTRFAIGLGIAAMTFAATSAFAATPLYFLNHNNLPASGTIATWDGATALTSWQGDGVPAAGPDVEVIGGQKWVKNYYMDSIGEPWNPAVGGTWGKTTGFRVTTATAAVPINGASFVVAVKKGAAPGSSQPWTSIIDVMYDKMTLGIRNDTGQIVVRRNGSVDVSSATIAVDQSAILSMVCQADGSYEVWADGVSVLNGGAQADGMTSWDPFRMAFKDEPDWASTSTTNWDQWWAVVMAAEPTVTAAWDWDNFNALANRDTYWGYTAQVPAFMQSINIGRNDPDGWTAFNGNIGDVKIFGEALSNTERLGLVSDMSAAMGMGAEVPEPGSIVAMFSGLVGLAGFGIRRKK